MLKCISECYQICIQLDADYFSILHIECFASSLLNKYHYSNIKQMQLNYPTLHCNPFQSAFRQLLKSIINIPMKPDPNPKIPAAKRPQTQSTQQPQSPTPPYSQLLLRQHDILNKLASTTFSADKIVRLTSAIIKIIRNFGLMDNLKVAEKLAIEIGQFRRLLRLDRLGLVIRDSVCSMRKKHWKKRQYFMTALRLLLLIQDISDIFAYLISLQVIKLASSLPLLRQRVADCYFLQCLCWLAYYLMEYLHSTDEQTTSKTRMLIMRYTLDSIVTYNDFSRRKGGISAKAASILSLASCMLNLHIAWR